MEGDLLRSAARHRYTGARPKTQPESKSGTGPPSVLSGKRGHGIEVTYALEATLTNVLDLTRLDVVERLETSKNEITEPWRFRPDGTIAPTHILGAAGVKSKRFSAIRYPRRGQSEGVAI
jgi:hypothetical protein